MLSCVFVFGATTPFAYMQSVTLRSGRMRSALTIWLVWPDLLVRFSVTSSHSAYVSPRNTSFHADWHTGDKNSGHRDSTLPVPFWRVSLRRGHAHPGRVPQRCAEVSRSDPGDVPEVIPQLRGNAAWPRPFFGPLKLVTLELGKSSAYHGRSTPNLAAIGWPRG